MVAESSERNGSKPSRGPADQSHKSGRGLHRPRPLLLSACATSVRHLRHVRHVRHARHVRYVRHARRVRRRNGRVAAHRHTGQAAELPLVVFLDELELHIVLLAVLVDGDGGFRGVLVDFLDVADFGGGAVRDAGGEVAGARVLRLLELPLEVFAGHRDEAVDVAVLHVVQRRVGCRLGVAGAATAEQNDQQDDAADDDQSADTAEDPRQRALLLGRFTAGETTGRWVAGRRALWRAVATGLALRRAVARLLLRETAAGRLALTGVTAPRLLRIR